MQITIDTPPLDSITDYRAALVALDVQLQPVWQYRAQLAQLASAPARIDEIAAGVLESTGRGRGAEWVQPVGAHDAYPAGWAVTHGGKTWESTTPNNVWEPGVSGWREQVADGYPEWVEPSGAHDAYDTGDRVSFEGANYESLIDGNTWSPSAYPAGWRLIP